MKAQSPRAALATVSIGAARVSILAMLCAPIIGPAALAASAGETGDDGRPRGPYAGRAVRFAISPPLRELAALQSLDRQGLVEIPLDRPESGPMSAVGSIDPVVQRWLPAEPAMPGPSISFEGLSNLDNFNQLGGRVVPPDTVGDVGPDHYVQMVNLVVLVTDKTGTPLLGPVPLSAIWAGLGPPCGSRNNGDPILLYDPLADRWMFSQFCTVADPNNHQLVAISQTKDPTGPYYLYDFVMPNSKFNDYPKFGVWPDAYYMTDNQFNRGVTMFLGPGAFAFDRARMLAGDPAPGYVYFDLDPLLSQRGLMPADVDGLVPPPAGAPNLMAYLASDEFGAPADAIRVFEFHADFEEPALSTFTERPESPIPVAPFDPRSPPGRDDIEQPPPANSTTDALDSIPDRLMHRLAYRNQGGHETLVVDHTVNVGTGTTIPTHQAGVRYYELRSALPAGEFTVQEQATFAPGSDNRWMGSAASDHQGNLAVGYSVSSLTTFPSIRYAGRLATDPPGGLFQGEATLIAGSFVQRSTGSRWGDYSAMSVDPVDDCTFWYTNEYYALDDPATTAEWQTRIGAFKFPSCAPAAKGRLAGDVTNALTSAPIGGASVLYASTEGTGQYAIDLKPGTYQVTASKAGFDPATASGVVVADGGTTVRNFALTPVPVVASGGAPSVTAESCAPVSGAVDHGESVTVSLALRNTGASDTSNLVATLQPTGGVTSPGAPQGYGALTAGGPSVARSFTFIADAALLCGGALDATLALQDGAQNLGTATFPMRIGALGAVVPTASGTGDIALDTPDLDTIEIPIEVNEFGLVADVDVRLRLFHTFDGDLVMTLVHPDGTATGLAHGRGADGDGFGGGANDCTGTPTTFDDEGSVSITAGTAPFIGSFRPEDPLSTFDGKSANGTWKIRISDRGPLDVGTVGCIELAIERLPFQCCPATPKEASPSADMTVARGSGTSLIVTYEPACGASQHVIYRGTGPIAGAPVWTTAVCALGASGTASFDPGALAAGQVSYFVIVGQGDLKEGSYGRASNGVERPEAAGAGACDRPQDLAGSCP